MNSHNITDKMIYNRLHLQSVLSHLLPFNENEKRFFDLLLDEGEIESSLITSDTEFQKKINLHPGLLWKAQNVKKINESKQNE